MAVTSNLSMYQGEDKVFSIIIYQGDNTTPQDITGWSLAFYVHPYKDPGSPYFTLTTGMGGGIAVVSAAAGTITVTVPRANTVDMLINQYGYYISRIDTGHDTVTTVGLLTLLLP